LTWCQQVDAVPQTLQAVHHVHVSEGAETVPSQADREAKRRRVALLAVAAICLAGIALGTVLIQGPEDSTTSPPPSHPSPTLTSGAATRAIPLDDTHVLLLSPDRWEALDISGSRTRLKALPSDTGPPVQALVRGQDWIVLTSDCQTKGLQIFRSSDHGRSWSQGQHVGFVNCSGGSYGRLFVVGTGLVLITNEDDAPETSANTSSDGVHWQAPAPRLTTITNRLAFEDNGSYVGVANYRNDGRPIAYADQLGGRERTTALPGKAQPVGITLTRTGSSFALLSEDGRAYRSSTGANWEALGRINPGCTSCRSWSLTATAPSTWWARVVDGKRSRYAVTSDAGRRWSEVPGPRAPQAAVYDDELLGWNANTAIVVRARHVWLTRNRGATWTAV
jgi:photosystem II stability/assembly factor-like uncharacterized protein